jgi:hypothetical protein
MRPAYYVPGQDFYPKYVGLCHHCWCLFGVGDRDGLIENAGGIAPLGRCPQCTGPVGMTERHRAAAGDGRRPTTGPGAG